MGFAKVAELNHYPGPRHVLDLADKLGLSDEQRRRTQAIFDQMSAEAVRLGRQLIEEERVLDSRFLEGSILEPELSQRVSSIAAIQGSFRTAHLRAHLLQRDLMTPDQIRQYDSFRGYEGPVTHGQHEGP